MKKFKKIVLLWLFLISIGIIQTKAINNEKGRIGSVVPQNFDNNINRRNFGIDALNVPGVKGDGINDDTQGLQNLLDSGAGTIYLPKPLKYYLISKTLKIHSGQTLIVDRNAIIKLADHACAHMITNADHIKGDSMITITGGIWDGNNITQTQEYHETHNGQVPYNPDRYLGVLFQFNNVSDLRVAELTLKDPETFGFQGGNLRRFTIEDITFDYNLKRLNMDGIHIHGNSHQGRITNLKGTTNDDLVALNADDGSMFEISRGPITDIQIDGIWSDNGYRAVRLLSCGSPVKRIKISNIYGNYNYEVIGFTNAQVHSDSKSTFEDISINGIFCSGSSKSGRQIWIESPATISNLTIYDYHRTEDLFPSDGIFIESGASIDNFSLSEITLVNRSGKPIIFLHNNGLIDNLNLTDIMLKGNTNTEVQLIKNSGKINLLNKSNIVNKGFEN